MLQTPSSNFLNCSFAYFLAPSPPIIKSKKIRSCENAALVCWESRDINPVDSYMVELSKLTDEENDDTITEWVTILSSSQHVEMKPFKVMWHQVAVRKDPLVKSLSQCIQKSASPILCRTTSGELWTIQGWRNDLCHMKHFSSPWFDLPGVGSRKSPYPLWLGNTCIDIIRNWIRHTYSSFWFLKKLLD